MIRIMVERHLKADKRDELLPLLRELRTAAIHQPGYVTGETLANVEYPSNVMVLSTWHSMEDWKAWEKSEQRIDLYARIEALLVEKPRVRIYQVMATEK